MSNTHEANQAVNNNRKKSDKITLVACLVWSLSAIFYFYENLLKMSTSVIVPELQAFFNISLQEIGYLGSMAEYAYACMQIPAGILMDRIGPKKLMPIAALLCGIGCLLFSISPNFYIAAMSRFLIGIGASFAVVGSMKIAALWFPSRYFATLAGLLVAVGMLGAAFGGRQLVVMLEAMSWQDVFIRGLILGVVLAVGIFLLTFRHAEKQIHTDNSVKAIAGSLKTVLASPQTWISSLYASLMFVPTIVIGFMWGVPFLENYFGVTKEVAIEINTYILFGWAFGGPFFGWLSDKIGRRKPVMAIAGVGVLATLCVALYIPALSILQMKANFLVMGAFSTGFVVAFSLVREINKEADTGAAVGFMNTLNTIGGALIIPLVGYVLDKCQAQDNVLLLEHYIKAFNIIPVCIIVSLVLLVFVKETHCKQLPQ